MLAGVRLAEPGLYELRAEGDLKSVSLLAVWTIPCLLAAVLRIRLLWITLHHGRQMEGRLLDVYTRFGWARMKYEYTFGDRTHRTSNVILLPP